MSISYHNYKLLDKNHQVILLFEKGVQLCSRTNNDYRLFLFQLDNFYVETWFDKNRKELARIEICDNTSVVEPYLHSINIMPLLLLLS